MTDESERRYEIIVLASIPAVCFDNPRVSHLFVQSSLQPKLESERVVSENGVPWVVTKVRSGRFGWPRKTLNELIDRGSIRLFIDGEEQDDAKSL